MSAPDHHNLEDRRGNDAGVKRAELEAHRTFERHYRISALAELWRLGRETVRLLVKDEQGVIRIRLGRKKNSHNLLSA